jgi:cytoskeletal protein RodZ
MPTVAEQLRHAREQQSLSVYQVAEITKIKTDHIRALEAGEYDAFSAPVYIRGFVRTYARALRLDDKRVGADLEGELSKTAKFCEPPPLTNQPKGALDWVMLQLSKMNWRTAVGIAVVVLGLIIGGSLMKGCHGKASPPDSKAAQDPLRNLGPGLYQPSTKSPKSGEIIPLTPATNTAKGR